MSWQIEVGDSKIYTYTKYYIGLENKHESIFNIINEEGEKVEVTFKKGATIKYTITELPDSGGAKGKVTYNGNVTIGNQTLVYGIVGKTIVNKSYWKEVYENREDGTVEGNYIVSEEVRTNSFSDLTEKIIHKRNWKSGWRTYLYIKNWNATHTIYESELTSDSGLLAFITPGYENLPLIINFLIVIVITRRK